MDASAIQTATGLSVDNAQAVGALTAAAVREEDVAAGRYDGAEVWHWLVDWERPELRVLLFRGSFGENPARRRGVRGRAARARRGAERAGRAGGDADLRPGARRCQVPLRRGAAGLRGGGRGRGGQRRRRPGGLGARRLRRRLVRAWRADLAVSGENAGETASVKADRRGGEGRRSLRLWRAPGRPVAVGRPVPGGGGLRQARRDLPRQVRRTSSIFAASRTFRATTG